MYNSCKEGIQTAKSDNQDQLAEASILVTAILNFVRVLIAVNQRVDDLLRHKNAAHQAGGLILTYN